MVIMTLNYWLMLNEKKPTESFFFKCGFINLTVHKWKNYVFPVSTVENKYTIYNLLQYNILLKFNEFIIFNIFKIKENKRLVKPNVFTNT